MKKPAFLYLSAEIVSTYLYLIMIIDRILTNERTLAYFICYDNIKNVVYGLMDSIFFYFEQKILFFFLLAIDIVCLNLLTLYTYYLTLILVFI